MAERLMQKTFSKLNAEISKAQQDMDPQQGTQKAARTEEEKLRKLSAPMSASDAVKRILLAWTDKDYFRLLGMPPVDVDALGKPSWDCTDTDISKAYRQLSRLVHPDKNPGDSDAREAFERLNEAHKILQDPGKLEDIKLKQLDAAKLRRSHAEACATIDERVVLNAKRGRQAKEARLVEEVELSNKFGDQMKARLESTKKRRDAHHNSKRGHCSDDDDEATAAANAMERMLSGGDTKSKPAADSDEDDPASTGRNRGRQRKKRSRSNTFPVQEPTSKPVDA